MTRGRFWHILTCFLPIAAIELSPEQVDYWKPDIVIDKRWVVNWSNIYYCLGTHKNRHCLTTFLRLSGCIRRSALLLSGSIRVCFDFVFPWSWANETTDYNNLFTLIHEEILSVTWEPFSCDSQCALSERKTIWRRVCFFNIRQASILSLVRLMTSTWSQFLFIVLEMLKINISSVANSSNHRNLAVVINFNLYSRIIKGRVFAFVRMYENYITISVSCFLAP